MTWGFVLIVLGLVLTSSATVAYAMHGQPVKATFFGAFTALLTWVAYVTLMQGR